MRCKIASILATFGGFSENQRLFYSGIETAKREVALAQVFCIVRSFCFVFLFFVSLGGSPLLVVSRDTETVEERHLLCCKWYEDFGAGCALVVSRNRSGL